MPALTDAEYGALRNALYRKGRGKEELKLLPNLPSKAKLKAVFQVFEDRWDAAFAPGPLKVDVDAAAGATVPVPLVKQLGRVWLASKLGRV